MATVAELEKQVEILASAINSAVARITDLENSSVTKADLEDVNSAPFVGYVTTKYIGDGMSKEWQTRPALLIGDDTAIVLAPDDEGGMYTVRGVKHNEKNHIPNTWHNSE